MSSFWSRFLGTLLVVGVGFAASSFGGQLVLNTKVSTYIENHGKNADAMEIRLASLEGSDINFLVAGASGKTRLDRLEKESEAATEKLEVNGNTIARIETEQKLMKEDVDDLKTMSLEILRRLPN